LQPSLFFFVLRLRLYTISHNQCHKETGRKVGFFLLAEKIYPELFPGND